MIAGFAEADDVAFAAAVGHRARACEGLHTGRVGEALPIIAELDEQAWREEFARAQAANRRGRHLGCCRNNRVNACNCACLACTNGSSK